MKYPTKRKTNVSNDKLLIKQLLLLIFGSLLSLNIFALDLKDAKEQGLVGERKDGLVGYVTPAPSVELKAVVEEVNQKRKQIFAETAANTGATEKQVANRFYERAIEATKPNQFYQDVTGNWVKK